MLNEETIQGCLFNCYRNIGDRMLTAHCGPLRVTKTSFGWRPALQELCMALGMIAAFKEVLLLGILDNEERVRELRGGYAARQDEYLKTNGQGPGAYSELAEFGWEFQFVDGVLRALDAVLEVDYPGDGGITGFGI